MAFAKYPPENISEAINVFKQDVELAHGIVHGDENTEVLTEKGLVPSFSKVINTFEVQGQQVISEFGWTQVGTFAAGFTFTSPNQVGQDVDGNWWRWNGALPKTVTAGTLPSSDVNYKLVGDGVLRSDLAAIDSETPIAGQPAKKYFTTFDTVAEAQSAITTEYVGRRVQWLGYHALSDGGSGWGIVKSGSYTADGGSIIAVGVNLYIEQNVKGSSQNVRKWGARGDVVTDPNRDLVSGTNDTQAFKNAIAYVSSFGGDVHAPEGLYLITETLYLPSGVTMKGAGSFNGVGLVRRGASTLFCSHTGPAMVSFKGSNGCALRDIALWGDKNAKPKTGLCMGRATLASAGHHQVNNISIQGWFTVCAIYSIASEENEIRKVFSWNFGGDALYGFVTSTQDIFDVDSMVMSTNLACLVQNVILYVTSSSPSSAGILMECSEQMGNWHFSDCYQVQQAGTYVRIRSGEIDGLAPFGPITFTNCSGEPLAGGNPIEGYAILANVPVLLRGLSITGSRFQMFAGAEKLDIRQDSNVTLLNPNIIIQPPEAFPYAVSQVVRNKIKGGIVSVGRQYEWTDATLINGWANEFGPPNPQAGWLVSPTGEVTLRGIVSGTSATAIFVLPADLHPDKNLTFVVSSGSGAIGRVSVATNGDVFVSEGVLTSVLLSSVRFQL